MGVASIVIDDGGTEDEAIAALLHDAPEDRGGRERLEDIRARFGDPVATIVEDCTDSWTMPKAPWAERKKQYMEHARTLTPSSLRVSAADKVHNAYAILRDLRNVGDKVWERFNAERGRHPRVLPVAGAVVPGGRRRTPGRRARPDRPRDRARDGLLTAALEVPEHAFAMLDLLLLRRRASVRFRPDGWVSSRTSLGFRRNGKRITMHPDTSGRRDRTGHGGMGPPKPDACATPPSAARTGSAGART